MVQTVELLLDPALDAAVRRQWQALLAAGLPSQARHTGESNAPHITLAITDDELPTPVEEALPSALTLPIPVRLGGLLIFGSGPYVLVRTVVASHLLLNVHAAVARELRSSILTENLRPGAWSPHVTLAHRLDRGAVPTALAALAPFDDGIGAAVSARRWDSRQRRA